MPTNTDTMWTARLADHMPANFANNMSDSFSVANNEVYTTMMNMIGRTVVNAPDNPMNPFAKYTKPIMEYGDTIQDYKVQYAAADDYDPENNNPFTPVPGTQLAQYYKLDDSTQYTVTVWDRELRKAFAGQEAFNDFVSAKLDSLLTADTLDKRTKWKKYLSATDKIIGAKPDQKVEVETGADYAENLLTQLREFAENYFREPSTKYNAMGDTAISNEVDIIMKRTDKLAIDRFLSGVYNMNKLDIDANILLVDDFGAPTGTNDSGTGTVTPGTGAPTAGDELVAIVCDARALSYTPTMMQSSSQYNAKGLYNQNFYTVEGIYSVAKYRNFVQVFAKAPGA